MKEFFQSLIKENKLAHGYIFFGPDENILAEFSVWLADFLENYRSLQGDGGLARAVMFDALVIKSGEDSIGIDKIREIKNFLWQKPVRSIRRTVIVEQADKLTSEAQNAILKVAEEPPAGALIVLLIQNPELLLDTLISRFQKIFIPHPFSINTGNSIFQSRKGEGLSVKKYVNDFLKEGIFQKKQIIKDILSSEPPVLDGFIKGLMLELDRDPVKNWRILKELCHRWRLIRQYNVNKRLQLEAFARIMNYE